MNLAVNNGVRLADFEELFKAALRHRDRADYEKALVILQQLSKRRPRSASVHAILGDVYWRQKRLKEAVGSFRRATKLSPNSELASLGLYHTLLESGREKAARAEMARFLALAPSKEYAAIVKKTPVRKFSEKKSDLAGAK
jgi:predicted Zn-dependent protease